MEGDGYSYESHALQLTRDRFRLGASTLDRATQAEAKSVDAGASSDVVGDAMARVQQIAVVLAQYMDDTADKVDRADGSYGEVENTNEGRLRYEKYFAADEPQYGPGAVPRTDDTSEIQRRLDDPLEHAPVDERGADRPGRAPAPEVDNGDAEPETDDGSSGRSRPAHRPGAG
ncbi:hypothetical protein SAMN06265360_10178 [Haloechinothrix alba]|uniref:Uncharacterized protein n=1 Tax=Haloechinothrix alba TaxID=664784 RepID=A0A238UZ51_9PSEU|nr:hypothetical protein [Haloechinothrix alba]SNR27500.1 hypothetical protein SAMN06265360_10178 [Haloechinothrix alba]